MMYGWTIVLSFFYDILFSDFIEYIWTILVQPIQSIEKKNVIQFLVHIIQFNRCIIIPDVLILESLFISQRGASA